MPFRDSELNAFAEQIKAIKGSISALTIVCGAGVSMASVNEKLKKKISWLGLIQQGLEFAQALGLNVTEELNQIQTQEQKKALNADQLIELAGKVQKHLQGQDQYASWLQNNVGDAVLPDPNKMILINALADCAKISHVNLATTNYDYLLSRAQGWNPAMSEHPNSPISWQDKSGLAAWLQDKSERVLHLHGDAYNADSVIFSQADYDRLNKNGKKGWTARIRSAISTTHVVLFIGCGNTTNDPAFQRILELYKGSQDANRFNNKWFQLAKKDELKFPNGIKKLTYGDKHDDLPIFVREVLLPLLKTHLAKTETDKNEITKTVENNQIPLQAPTQISQAESVTDKRNNQSQLTSMLMQPQQPSSPTPSDVQNAKSDLLKKAIIELSEKLLINHRLVVDILIQPDKNSNNNNSFIKWLETEKPDDKFAAVLETWRDLKSKNNEIWLEVNEFLMLLAIHSFVEKENYKNIDVYQSHTGHDKLADYILPILVAINIKYGIGCNLEKVDNKWLSNNLILKSKTTPLEAYKYNNTPLQIREELSKIARMPLASFDNEEVKAYVNRYKKTKNANIALVYDDGTLTENQLYQIKEWGILTIQSNSDEVDKKFEDIFNNLIKQFNYLDLSCDDGVKNNPTGGNVINFNGQTILLGSNVGPNGTVNNTVNESNLISNLDELLKINIQTINDRKEEIIELKKIIEEKRRDSSSLEKVKKAKEWIELYINAPQTINEGIESTGKLKNLLLPILSNLSTFL